MVLFLSLLIITGCSNRGTSRENVSQDGGGAPKSELILADPTRKVIYNVSISIQSEDLLATNNQIKNKFIAGEEYWVAKEELEENYNYIIFRVKIAKLTEFVQFLRNEYETTQFKWETEDVTKDYVDIQARKDSLLASRARLEELKVGATRLEITQLEQRIAEIDTELNQLSSTLITYDSLTEFATVKVYLHKKSASPVPPKYDEELGNSFKAGWNAVLSILKFFGKAIATLLPFLIIIVPVGGVIMAISYREKIKDHFKRKKKEKKEELTEESVEEKD